MNGPSPATLRLGTPEDAPAAARLHRAEIGEGFLPTLGQPFLERMYRRLVRWPGGFMVVAGWGAEVCAFAAATEHVGDFYRTFLVHDGLVAALGAGGNLARSWRKAVETLRYPSANGDLPRAELLAMAVSPPQRGQGIGRQLVSATTAELSRRGVDGVRVVAGSDNQAALRLYQQCGFRPVARREVHRGAPSEVLAWP